MSATAALAMVSLIAVILALYWLPSILAYVGRHPDPVPVVLINALLGWTVLGWVWALARLARRPTHPRGVSGAASSAHLPDSAATPMPLSSEALT